jgi:hypothetical protein
VWESGPDARPLPDRVHAAVDGPQPPHLDSVCDCPSGHAGIQKLPSGHYSVLPGRELRDHQVRVRSGRALGKWSAFSTLYGENSIHPARIPPRGLREGYVSNDSVTRAR